MDKVEIEGEEEIVNHIGLVHAQDLIKRVKDVTDRLEEGETSYQLNPATGELYECKESYNAALVSASAAVTGLTNILAGDYS